MGVYNPSIDQAGEQPGNRLTLTRVHVNIHASISWRIIPCVPASRPVSLARPGLSYFTTNVARDWQASRHGDRLLPPQSFGGFEGEVGQDAVGAGAFEGNQ